MDHLLSREPKEWLHHVAAVPKDSLFRSNAAISCARLFSTTFCRFVSAEICISFAEFIRANSSAG